jgi:hypothetical protein
LSLNLNCCIVLRFQTTAEALDSLERGVINGEELDLVVAEVHPATTAMDNLVVFHHVVDALEVPFVSKFLYSELHCLKKIFCHSNSLIYKGIVPGCSNVCL